MADSEIILESWSPVCDIQAIVEENDNCYYFYLWVSPGSESSYIKSCWICNSAEAPEEIDTEAMKAGMAPVMPKKYISHPNQGIRLNPEELSIVWFEEGDAAALFEKERLLCVIPGWSGYQGFNGYSRYAAGMMPYAWELTEAEEVLLKRAEKSREFWDYFEGEYWEDVQQAHIQALEAFFGTYEKYFAIDGETFPPKALVSGRKEGICYGITAGVSLIPMPRTEQYYNEEASDYRRIELGFAATEEQQDICMKMYSFISSISALPWNEISFLGHGHTIPCNAIEGFSAVWLLNSRLIPEIAAPDYKDFMGDKINLLWVIPLKQEEYESVMELGVEEVLQRMGEKANKLHIFDGQGKNIT